MNKLFLLLGIVSLNFSAHAELEITISGGAIRPVPIAIVPFGQTTENAVPLGDTDLARVVEDDLRGSGLFAPFAREDMITQPQTEESVRYENWRSLGVEHLVIGSVQRAAAGGWAIEFRLLDVFRGSRTLGYRIPLSAGGERRAAHQISDLIYAELTGHRGVFNTRIAYVTAEGPVSNRSYKLLIADADGVEPRQLVRSSEPLLSPVWSPDGQQMAFVAFEQGQAAIYVQTVATGAVRKITDKPGINGAPSFSPDGRQLAVTLSYEGNPEIYLIELASGVIKRMTDDPAIDTEAAFSPDGKHLVFTSDRAGRPQIYRLAIAGGAPERLTFEGNSNARASYSPDGQRLALVHQNDNGFQIAVMELKNRELRVLSEGPLDESPSFAPNGIVIIYSGRGSRGAELATVAINTGIRQQLRQTGDVREPAWSPYFQ